MSDALLSVENLSIAYHSEAGVLHALRNASIEARAGEVIGIVGESGCGKSTLASAIINLLAPNAVVQSGEVKFRGRDILALPAEEQRKLRGRSIAMIFQDPMSSFNPVLTIGEQLMDFQENREGVSRGEKRKQAEAMLARVGIADPRHNFSRYVHELSGGMRQRVAIAAALLMSPDVLMADEPTTALDVTMEAQIIHLLRELRTDFQGTIIVITHHLGLVGELCDRVYVMYAGEVVEEAGVDQIFHNARHPYTRALALCDPAHLEEHTPVLPTIPGRLPDLANPPQGCSFAARCSLVFDRCRNEAPPMLRINASQQARCFRAFQ